MAHNVITFQQQAGRKVVSDKPGLIVLSVLVLAVLGLLLWQYVGLRGPDGPLIGFGYSSAQISEARKICTGLHGSESERNKRLSDCSGQCASAAGDPYRDCLLHCREESQAFANCLLQYTTPP
jgi:hypothetical protein